jgi:hypothetical protein
MRDKGGSMINHLKWQRNTFLIITVFALGLLIRLMGLPFNGMGDLDQIIFEWGTGVRAWGLGKAFRENYGLFSWALYGYATAVAEHIPRFWWIAYKLMEVVFETALFGMLFLLLPRGRRHYALLLYWINPWFLIHGGWHGFWEGPHILFALIAILCLRWIRSEKISWALVGACVMTSAMFKPQGLLYFVVPLGIYLTLKLLVQRRPLPLIYYAAGVSAVVGIATAIVVAGGGDVMAVPKNYASAAATMPNLSNGCPNIWTVITRVVQAIGGQSGPVYDLVLPQRVSILFHLLASCLTAGLVALFALRLNLIGYRQAVSPDESKQSSWVRMVGWGVLALFGAGLLRTSSALDHDTLVAGRYSLKYTAVLGLLLLFGCVALFAAPAITRLARRLLQAADALLTAFARSLPKRDIDPALGVLLMLAFASLVFPQLGVHAHINHTYTALVLLIPLAIGNRRILSCWVVMIAIHLYTHLATYQLGRSTVLPSSRLDYPTAQPLLSQINAALSADPYASLLSVQNAVNQFLQRYLPQEPVITVLSAVQFVCVLIVIREMFTGLRETEPIAAPRSVLPNTTSPRFVDSLSR